MKKLRLATVVSLVIGSQIGSGVFLLPVSLSLLGPTSLFGWVLSGMGAILLSLVFGKLSMRTEKGGGPHVYVEEAFGRKAAFFCAWTYWLVSWVSSLAVVIAAATYLAPLLGIHTPLSLLLLEILILSSVTWINMKAASLAGSLELFLTLLKCIPLLLVPIASFFFFQKEHFASLTYQGPDFLQTLNSASLMTFWGFVGLETVTTAAGVIENPQKTIPRAVFIGTAIVACIYFLNSLSIMGVVPPAVLKTSQAPYADAAAIVFGHSGHIAIALIAFLACIGTLNAWVLTSGQIAAEAARQSLFPSLFSKTNKKGAPYMSILISFLCSLLILIATLTPSALTQLQWIIDISVITFLWIYLACTIALLTILTKKEQNSSIFYKIVGYSACIFCAWILAFVSWQSMALCAAFVCSGIPIYKKEKSRITT